MKLRILIGPQPIYECGLWVYSDIPFVSEQSLESHLFNDVYGNFGAPLGSAYPDSGATSSDVVEIHGQRFEVADVAVSMENNMWFWDYVLDAVKTDNHESELAAAYEARDAAVAALQEALAQLERIKAAAIEVNDEPTT